MASFVRALRAHVGSLLVSSIAVVGIASAVAGCGFNNHGSGGLPGVGPTYILTITAGNNQSGPVGTELPLPLVVTVSDQNGNLYFNLPVVWTVGIGGGSVTATIAPTDSLGQSHTYLTLGPTAGQNTAVATVGNVSITFTETGGAGGVVGGLTMFASGFPSHVSFGTPGFFTVTIKDSTGAIDAGYTGTVKITSSDPGATLPANYTFTAADAGSHTFSVTLNTVGTWSITATDVNVPTLTATESGIVVGGAPASKYIVTGMPSPYNQGALSDIVVNAVDSSGITDTSYGGTVKFTSTDAGVGVVLPAPYTFTVADAGIHRFHLGVKLQTVGSQTVTATDSVTATIKGSQTVTVVATVRVTSLTASTATAFVGATGTDPLSWTFTGAPTTVTLNGTNMGATGESTTSPGGTTPPVPFPASPTTPDPRAFYRLTATGPASEVVEVTQDSQANTTATTNGVATFSDGSYITVGSFGGVATFGGTLLTSVGGKDAFIVRYNKDGTLAWAKQGGGGSDDEAMGVATFSDGSSVVTGYFTGSATFGTASLFAAGPLTAVNVFVVRYKSDGTVDWGVSAGGITAAVGNGVAAMLDGSLSVVGYYTGTASFNASTSLSTAGGKDVFVAHYAANGKLAWAKSGGGSGDDVALGVASSPDAGTYVTGTYTGTATFGASSLTSAGAATSAFFVRYNEDGTVAWANKLTGTGADGGQAATAFPDGSCAFTGFYNAAATLTPGGALAAASGSPDVFVVRFTSAGAFSWSAVGTGATVGQGTGIAALPDGSVDVTGSYSGTATFGATSFTSAGATDGFLARYTAAGGLVNAVSFGGTGADAGKAVAAFTDGSVVVGGTFSGTATFSAGVGLDAIGAPDAFAVKFTPVNYLMLVIRPTGIDTASASSDGGTFSSDTCISYGITACPDGGTISVGWYSDDGVNNVTIGSTLLPICNPFGGSNENLFVVKNNADGTVAWVVAPTPTSAGTSSCAAFTVSAFADGSCVVAGNNLGGTSIDFGGGITTTAAVGVWVARFSASGTCTAATLFSMPGVYYYVSGGLPAYGPGSNAPGALSVGACPDGTYALTGGYSGSVTFGSLSTITAAGTDDMYVVHFKATAPSVITPDWVNTGGASSNLTAGLCLAAAYDGTIVVSGIFSPTTAGGTASAKFSTTSGSASSLTDSSTASGYEDQFLVHYDASGKLLWAKQTTNGDASSTTGTTYCETYGVSVCPDGTIRAGGWVADSVIFGPGETTTTTLTTPTSGTSPPNYFSGFLAKYKLSDGSLVWVEAISDSTGYAFIEGVSCRPDGTCIVGGFVESSTATFDSTHSVTPTYGLLDAFVAEYKADGTVAWVKQSVHGYATGYGVAALPDGSVSLVGGYGFIGSPAIFGTGEPNFQSLTDDYSYENFIAHYFNY